MTPPAACSAAEPAAAMVAAGGKGIWLYALGFAPSLSLLSVLVKTS